MYTVNIYTAGQDSRPITVPMTKWEAKKLARRFNESNQKQGISEQKEHFYVEKTK